DALVLTRAAADARPRDRGAARRPLRRQRERPDRRRCLRRDRHVPAPGRASPLDRARARGAPLHPVRPRAAGVNDVRTVPADIAAAAVASFDGADAERLRTLVQALTRHLHAFATEVGLTQGEWEEGIRILTETGHITD